MAQMENKTVGQNLVPGAAPAPQEKLTSRGGHPGDTHFLVGGVKIGSPDFVVIAGPCSVEGPEQMFETAEAVKAAGASILRGGAFKPRTSPYSFQGMGEDGLKLLSQARMRTGLPIVTEVMDSSDIPMVQAHADVIQVGARNVQNFSLLKKLGKTDKPILLKRGLMTTVDEFLMSAEYIMSAGNCRVILCERGIRTFETATRNTLDLGIVPVLKEKTHLPVIVDPCHALGIRRFVAPLAKAALAVGADGIMVESHVRPEEALCDGEQSLRPAELAALIEDLKKVAPFFDKRMRD